MIITSVISSNLALSLGMIGALSIVRYRTPIKSVYELALLFFLITLGVTASDGTKTSAIEIVTVSVIDDPNVFVTEDLTVAIYRDNTDSGIITDNYNNLSSNSVVFIIGENNRLNIKNVMNFPNPFSDYTTFKFDLPQEDQSIFVNLEIYDLRGNKVYNYTHTYEFSPLVVEDIYWNGNDLNNYPLPQGIYIYKLHVNNLVNGKKVTVHNKVFKKL